ncbi:MAG: TIGR04255 family protein [Candidatus Dormibacteraeota bacterium]|jgi:uncharacterized protein (TIGR04255 family)|nr:TIGR04255 family protein [Candidatus Dormibacteraeota bacterium]
MPRLQLQAPRPEPLQHSPLELVVCQVRHERNLVVADAKRALAVHAHLAEKYPTVEEASGVAINILGGPAGVSTAADQQRGWNFRSTDRNWTVVLMPEFVSLETRAYTDWDDFSERLSELVGLVERELQPSLEQRLGLRFIDRITDPKMSTPSEWGGWIDERLLGPILHDAFGPAIKSIQQVVQLDGGDGMEVVLRHGCLLEGPAAGQAWPYLLDYDCSLSRARAFSAGAVRQGVEGLHELALSAFQAALTPRLYEHLLGGG